MEMVMKFPNGETPNLLIEVFNYNTACALQIRYTSGFGRSRRGCESVTDTCVRKHRRQETFRMLRTSSVCSSSDLMEANCVGQESESEADSDGPEMAEQEGPR